MQLCVVPYENTKGRICVPAHAFLFIVLTICRVPTTVTSVLSSFWLLAAARYCLVSLHLVCAKKWCFFIHYTLASIKPYNSWTDRSFQQLYFITNIIVNPLTHMTRLHAHCAKYCIYIFFLSPKLSDTSPIILHQSNSRLQKADKTGNTAEVEVGPVLQPILPSCVWIA